MREYTKKEKFLNWLHYNKWWLMIGAAAIWAAGYMLLNMLGIGRVEPDYQISYIGNRQLPDDTVEVLEHALAGFGEDLNGDGQVAVSLTQHILSSQNDTETMVYSYAAEITVLADLTEGDSTFFLLEDPVSFQLAFQILANPDGSTPGEDDFEALDKVFRWADCPALAALDLGGYEDYNLDHTESGDVQDLLSHLYLGRRCFYIPEQNEYPEANEAFWQALTAGLPNDS